MCHVNPRPINVRPFQDQVRTSADRCDRNELQQLRDRVSQLEGKVDAIYQMFAGASAFGDFGCHDFNANNLLAPGAGCLPPPSADLQSAPAGKGLQTNPPGWPQGSVRTAGGYTVVPEGKDAAWRIYGPNQAPSDKPLSRIWGDPHVDEADGQRWDFTKSSNFRLPDGTLIDVKTTSETGQSVTQSLNIVNGSDRVSIDGINHNRPQLSAVSRDGFQYRANVMSQDRDTFVLGGTNRHDGGNDRVQWARERNGQIEGVIGGTINNIDGRGSYGQRIDAHRTFQVDPSLRPDPAVNPGAWGNQLRGEVVDAAAQNLPPYLRDYITSSAQLGDSVARFRDDLAQSLRRHCPHAFGGLFSLVYGGRQEERDPFGFGAAERLFDTLRRQRELADVFGAHRHLARTLFV